MVLLSAALMMEKADEVLVPAVYAEMSIEFDVGLAKLGALTFSRALVQALAAPLASLLAVRYNRGRIIGLGAVFWAVSTALVGLSSSFQQAAFARAANGLGLAVVIPAVKSLVADLNHEEARGVAFGWLHGAGQLGTVIGGMFATSMGDKTLMGIAGWRAAFLIVACLSLLLGIALCFLVQEPQHHFVTSYGRSLQLRDAESKGIYYTIKQLLKDSQAVFHIKTFWVIVAQGVVGSTPWAAMLFFTLWMELLGFNHFQAASNVGLFSIGNAVGSIFGGWVGDKAAAYLPNTGRILCSQFSAGVGIPLSACLLFGIPKKLELVWVYGTVLFFMGSLMSWNSPATNWPIFSEIVPAHLRTTIYAIDMAIENSVAAAGTPLVGLLSEHVFGFKKLAGQTEIKLDQENAQALADGLFVCIAIPFSICVLIISLLYFTYPEDRDHVKRREYGGNMFEMESTIGKVEAADSIDIEHYSDKEYEAEQPLRDVAISKDLQWRLSQSNYSLGTTKVGSN